MRLAAPTGRARRRFVTFICGAGMLVVCTGDPVLGQSFSPYADFQAMTLPELASLQVKLTFAGRQRTGRPSVLFTAIGNQPNIDLFTPYCRPGVRYHNDGFGPILFEASVQELRAVIDNVGLVPAVTDGDVDPGGYVSFALLNTAGGTTRVFEAVVNRQTGALLFDKLLSALEANQLGRKAVWDFGCGAGTLPTTPPEDLAGRVSITFSGFRRDPSEHATFVGRVRVVNTSGTMIVPPLSLVMVRHGNAAMLDAHRTTCNLLPGRSPYIDLFIGGGLAPGAGIDQVIRFTNPSLEKFDVTFRAFGGPGTR